MVETTLTLRGKRLKLAPEEVGFRFVDRKGRYICQAHVWYGEGENREKTWVDIPLVPEVYA